MKAFVFNCYVQANRLVDGRFVFAIGAMVIAVLALVVRCNLTNKRVDR